MNKRQAGVLKRISACLFGVLHIVCCDVRDNRKIWLGKLCRSLVLLVCSGAQNR